MNQSRELEANKAKLNDEQNEISRTLRGVDQDLISAEERLKNAQVRISYPPRATHPNSYI
jgi:hypothetical protein